MRLPPGRRGRSDLRRVSATRNEPSPCDCLIVGGGPAGASLALLLAARGIETVLVDDGRARPSGPFESLLPGALPMLERIGCLDLVRSVATVDPLRHGAIWGQDELQWQADGERGLLLRRGEFDAGLRAAAAARGVRVHAGARVVDDLARATGDGVTVRGDAAETFAYRPRLVVVATGRGARNGEVVRSGPATLAVTFVGELSPAARGCAVVEAVPDGWTWLQALPDGRASVAVLVDPGHEGVLDAPPGVRARRALATCRGPAAALATAPVRFAVDATARCVATAKAVLLVGDAAATIDPLASQGVEKAFASSDHAAAVVATSLRQPESAAALRDEQRRWEHGLWSAHQERARAFHAAERRFAGAPFWRARHRTAAAPVHEPESGALYAAAAAVRPVVALRRIGDTFEPCDGVEHGEVRLTHLGFVPVAPLLAAFASPCTLQQGEQLAARDPRCFVLPPFAMQQALRELVRRGFLSAVGNAAGSP